MIGRESETMKTLKLDFEGEVFKVCFFVSTYIDNDRLAVIIMDEDGEDFADLTVNLSHEPCPAGCAFLDTNGCVPVEDFVEKYKLGEFTGYYGRSGYCLYPLYRLDMERIRKYAIEEY